MGDGRYIVIVILNPGNFSRAPEVKATFQIGAVNCYRANLAYIVVAVYIVQVRKVYGVLCCFLGMTRELKCVQAHFAPLLPGGRVIRQAPLWLPSAAAPPGKHQAKYFSGFIYFQFGGSGSGGVRSGNALAGCIVLKSVKRANEATVAHPAADVRAQVGTHVRTYCLSHADATFLVTPGDDFFAQPGLPDQFFASAGSYGL